MFKQETGPLINNKSRQWILYLWPHLEKRMPLHVAHVHQLQGYLRTFSVWMWNKEKESCQVVNFVLLPSFTQKTILHRTTDWPNSKSSWGLFPKNLFTSCISLKHRKTKPDTSTFCFVLTKVTIRKVFVNFVAMSASFSPLHWFPHVYSILNV